MNPPACPRHGDLLPTACAPCTCAPGTAPPIPSVQTGGRHRARLNSDDRQALRRAIAEGYHDHTADDRVAAAAEVIIDRILTEHRWLLDRECDVLAQGLHVVGAYPLNYPRTPDGIRLWAHAHAVAGTTIEKDGD